MRAGRWGRVARGGAIASLATFVAALAHTVGGGEAPGLLAIVVSLTFSVLLAIAVAGARASVARTTVSVVATQLALHVLYSLSTPAGAGVAPAGAASGHAHGAATVLLPVAGAAHGPLHYSPLMVLTHLLAAAVTVVAILRGRAAFAAVGAAARLVGRPLIAALSLLQPVLPTHGRPSAAVPAFEHRPIRLGVVFAALRYRGPPIVAAVR